MGGGALNDHAEGHNAFNAAPRRDFLDHERNLESPRHFIEVHRSPWPDHFEFVTGVIDEALDESGMVLTGHDRERFARSKLART